MTHMSAEKTIWVGSLNRERSADDVKRFFARYGDVAGVKVHLPPDGKFMFAWVTFASAQDAVAAKEELDGREIAGFSNRPLKIEMYREKNRGKEGPQPHLPPPPSPPLPNGGKQQGPQPPNSNSWVPGFSRHQLAGMPALAGALSSKSSGAETGRPPGNGSGSGTGGTDTTRRQGVTVWVGSLCLETKEEDLRQRLSEFGPLGSIRLQTARGGKTQFALVDFVNAADGEQAAWKLDNARGLSISGRRPLRVQLAPSNMGGGSRTGTDGEREHGGRGSPDAMEDMALHWEWDDDVGITDLGGASRHLFVGNLVAFPSQRMLEQLFSKFGEIESLRAFNGKPFAFVAFYDVLSAAWAHNALDGRVLAAVSGSRPMKVEYRLLQGEGARPTGEGGEGPRLRGGSSESRPGPAPLTAQPVQRAAPDVQLTEQRQEERRQQRRQEQRPQQWEQLQPGELGTLRQGSGSDCEPADGLWLGPGGSANRGSSWPSATPLLQAPRQQESPRAQQVAPPTPAASSSNNAASAPAQAPAPAPARASAVLPSYASVSSLAQGSPGAAGKTTWKRQARGTSAEQPAAGQGQGPGMTVLPTYGRLSGKPSAAVAAVAENPDMEGAAGQVPAGQGGSKLTPLPSYSCLSSRPAAAAAAVRVREKKGGTAAEQSAGAGQRSLGSLVLSPSHVRFSRLLGSDDDIAEATTPQPGRQAEAAVTGAGNVGAGEEASISSDGGGSDGVEREPSLPSRQGSDVRQGEQYEQPSVLDVQTQLDHPLAQRPQLRGEQPKQPEGEQPKQPEGEQPKQPEEQPEKPSQQSREEQHGEPSQQIKEEQPGGQPASSLPGQRQEPAGQGLAVDTAVGAVVAGDGTATVSLLEGSLPSWLEALEAEVPAFDPVTPQQPEPPAALSLLHTCACCGASKEACGAPLRMCTGCWATPYCGPECQVRDWEERHHLECGRAAGLYGLLYGQSECAALIRGSLAQPFGRGADLVRRVLEALEAAESGAVAGQGCGG